MAGPRGFRVGNGGGIGGGGSSSKRPGRISQVSKRDAATISRRNGNSRIARSTLTLHESLGPAR